MRRALTALLVFVTALALALPATAAAPSPQKMAGQIRTLQKQVKTLQKTVKSLRTSVRQVQVLAVVALAYGACNSAVTADALQGSNAGQFGSTPVNDFQACSDLGSITGTTIARQPNQPTVSVFQTLLNIFK